jgi:hypothetical protein
MNDQCQVDPNPDYHACARFVALDTTVSPPAVAEQADFVDLDRDTFAPLVGVSRDGTAYFTMSASSAIAQEPIDHFATHRDLGDPIIGGSDEVLFRYGAEAFPWQLVDWGQVGSIIADPLDGHAVMAVYPTLYVAPGLSGQMAGIATRLEGDLAGPAGGTFTVDTGTQTEDGWGPRPNIGLKLAPDPGSPILWVRYSASPEVEDSPDGQRLRFAVEGPSSLNEGADLSSQRLGGVPNATTVTAYVQWRTANGQYSEPISQSLKIDSVMPMVTSLNRRFALGSVVKTAPVTINWTASDAPSGIAYIWTNIGAQASLLPATATSATGRVTIGTLEQVSVMVNDKAANYGYRDAWTKVLAKQGTSSGLTYTKTWRTSVSSHYLGGSTRYSSTAGAKFSYTTTARAVAFVSTKAKTRGKAKIYVDGKYVALVDLKSTTTLYHQIVWQMSWPTATSHKVTVIVVGTSGRPRVDADAFLRF